MRIATVTLNPAIDQTVSVDNFQLNAINRVQSVRFDASGKGVNVASFLTDYGYETAVTGYLGEANVAIFEHYFASKSIHDYFVRIPGQTRINIKVVDEVNQQTTDINLPGQAPPHEAMTMLFTTLDTLIPSCDWFVLSGSLPPEMPTTIYAQLITLLKAHNKYIILDSSGDAFKEGVQAGPTIVKPNIEELQQFAGYRFTSRRDIQYAAQQMLASEIALVVISMGHEGAMLVEGDTTLYVTPPDVMVKKTFGAGDAMVAGLVAARIQHFSLADCARLATAFAVGAIVHNGYHLPDHEMLLHYFHQSRIEYL